MQNYYIQSEDSNDTWKHERGPLYSYATANDMYEKLLEHERQLRISMPNLLDRKFRIICIDVPFTVVEDYV